MESKDCTRTRRSGAMTCKPISLSQLELTLKRLSSYDSPSSCLLSRTMKGALCAVILACRSQARGQELRQTAVAEARAAGVQSPDIEVMLLDLASLDSVRAFAQGFQQSGRPLHILINNAGLFDIGGLLPLTFCVLQKKKLLL